MAELTVEELTQTRDWLERLHEQGVPSTTRIQVSVRAIEGFMESIAVRDKRIADFEMTEAVTDFARHRL